MALSHHSSNSLLANASWAVDAAEVKIQQAAPAPSARSTRPSGAARVAVKRLLTAHPLEEKGVRQFFAEMEILANARHDNIVRFLGGACGRQPVHHRPAVPPASRCCASRAPARAARVLPLARRVALIYLLQAAVLHLDLKSANVLLDAHGHAKVCDFGLAHLKLGADVHTERMGSPMWTAPEVLKGEARDEKADTYSYGMLLYELLTRQIPYAGYAAAQVVMGVITNLLARPELPADAAHYPASLGDLMRECWKFEAAGRPDFAVVLDALELFLLRGHEVVVQRDSRRRRLLGARVHLLQEAPALRLGAWAALAIVTVDTERCFLELGRVLACFFERRRRLAKDHVAPSELFGGNR